MKAIILAAGKGERLEPITSRIPKPMITIEGKPILQHNIELCKNFFVTDIYINLHHFPNAITSYFGDGSNFGVKISYSYEEELLGTSGAVKKIANEFWNESNSDVHPGLKMSTDAAKDCFFVIYGDNFSNCNLQSLVDQYYKALCNHVIAFHYREDTSHSGVAEFDDENRVIRFIEKPKADESSSHWVNAGIYLLHPSILHHIPEGSSDFGKDIFPSLLNQKISLYGVCEDVTVKAFDTIEMYTRNLREKK